MPDRVATFLGAAAFAVLPLAAPAAVSTEIGASQSYLPSGQVVGGTTTEDFVFQALEGLRIKSLAFVGIGSSSGADLSKLTYTTASPYGGSTSGSLGTPIPIVGTIYAASAAPAAGYYLNAGDRFTISFLANQAVARNVNLSVDLITAPVPLPAAGVLLLAAVGGAVALRRRKTAAPA